MSAASTINLLGAAHLDAALVLMMFAGAVCGGPGIDDRGMARASAIVSDIMGAAAEAGFVDGDLFLELARRGRLGLIGKLADNAVVAVGGPAKFFQLLELSSAGRDARDV